MWLFPIIKARAAARDTGVVKFLRGKCRAGRAAAGLCGAGCCRSFLGLDKFSFFSPRMQIQTETNCEPNINVLH
jgi:hypothetical protein